MANFVQQAEIEVDTTYQTDVATDAVLQINIQDAAANPNTILANLNFGLKQNHINEVVCQPGELLMVEKNGLFNISFEIDDEGNLIVNAPDANNYSIDNNGNLIYTYR